jgi:hypothetical protein
MGVPLRISGDRDFDRARFLQRGDKIRSVAKARGMGHIGLCEAARRIAPERYEAVDPGGPERRDHLAELIAACAGAGQMRGRQQPHPGHPLYGSERALLRRAAGAVGDRNEIRVEAGQPRHGIVEYLRLRVGLRRKEFERDGGRANSR